MRCCSGTALRSVSPCEMDVGGCEDEDFEQIECEERESEEARAPEVLRDPGAPTPKEVEDHNVTHLPFRSWCLHCVSGKAQDRPHKRSENQNEKQIPEIVFLTMAFWEARTMRRPWRFKWRVTGEPK